MCRVCILINHGFGKAEKIFNLLVWIIFIKRINPWFKGVLLQLGALHSFMVEIKGIRLVVSGMLHINIVGSIFRLASTIPDGGVFKEKENGM
jgi:hypothetical protein